MFKWIWVLIVTLYTYKLPNCKTENLEIFLQLQHSSFLHDVVKTQEDKRGTRGIWPRLWLWYIYRRLFSTPPGRRQGRDHTDFLMEGPPANFLSSCVMPSHCWPLQVRGEPSHLMIAHSRSTETNPCFPLCHLLGSCNLLLAFRESCVLPGLYFSFSKFQGALPKF